MFSSHLEQLSDPYVSVVMANVKEMVTTNFNAFSIKNLIAIFKNIVSVEQKLKLPSVNTTYECVISNFMKGIEQKND